MCHTGNYESLIIKNQTHINMVDVCNRCHQCIVGCSIAANLIVLLFVILYCRLQFVQQVINITYKHINQMTVEFGSIKILICVLALGFVCSLNEDLTQKPPSCSKTSPYIGVQGYVTGGHRGLLWPGQLCLCEGGRDCADQGPQQRTGEEARNC